MKRAEGGWSRTDLPWLAWGAALLVAFGLKRFYSRASAEDLAWILAPTARAVGWLRGETLASSGAGWMAPDGSYFIAPACAGVSFLILAWTVAVLGFSHRLRSPAGRLGWWIGSLFGAYALTILVNTLRIVAAVELYRLGSVAGLTAEQAHRALGIGLYLGALWTVYGALDRWTGRRRAGAASVASGGSALAAILLVPGLYLGMTLGVPLLNGHFRQSGERYVEHAAVVSLAAVATAGAAALWHARERKLRKKL
ncbi:MAG TPA: exosortase K [Thermoanaerobaculia bacterium]|nr:exosortase K [Thermoanaerobaculia bacterium]